MKQLITSAARRLFVTEGYESTTIRRIAEAIEYTPGAIYSYFKDKDAILYAIHQEGFVDLGRRFHAAISAGKNPIEQLELVGQAYVTFGKSNPEMYHLMFVAQATSRTLNAAAEWPEGKATYDALRGLVQVAVKDGWIRPGDPEIISFGLWAAAHGAVTLEICDRCMVLPEDYRNNIAGSSFTYMLRALVIRSSDTAEPSPRPPAGPSSAPTVEPRRHRCPPES